MTSAYTLSRDGWNVTVLDRFDKVGSGASLGNGRQLSYSHTNALGSPGIVRQLPDLLLGNGGAFRMTLRGGQGYYEWLARFLGQSTPWAFRRNTLAVLNLARKSQHAMEKLLTCHPIEFDRRKAGKLVVFHDPKEVEAASPILKAKRAAGLRQMLLSSTEVTELEPALAHSSEAIAGALYAPDDESGDCHKFCDGLMELLEHSFGAQFRGRAQVTGIERRRDQVEVELASGETLGCDLAVVACGHAANSVLAPLGHCLPIQAMKGYSFTAPLGNAAPRVSVTNNRRRLVFTHCGDRMLVAGIAEMGKIDDQVDPVRLRSMIESAHAALPEAAVYSEADNGWAGLRPMTPDSQPIIGMLEPGIAVNAGHGMLGWTLAMGSAERLGEAVEASA
ncbi:D-amino acid dehydrogenase small subunit [Erythrobacter sp. THAF29]|nr:D-amino acid dehydrogenase small subunit [Erythrobacter sp. THAF29]